MSAPRRSRSAFLAFAASLIAFLFSFANVSCQGQRVASLSGVQLAFGAQIDNTDMWGNKRPQKVEPEPFALLAFFTAVAGAALALVGPATRRLTIAAGGGGALLPLLLINKVERDVMTHSSGMIDVSAGGGLLSAIFLFLIAAVLAWFGGREARPFSVSPGPEKQPDLS
ncbi:MAG TPA: hypothetical protein VGR95_07660 [Thermoanaerobaculia bacterium]|jgi:hypothetical protein|nr:hypothetical protein [Thermoanaerobaculia bacterium]